MPRTIPIVDSKFMYDSSWVVGRRATIHREQTEEGEIQYTVRVKDGGRPDPFLLRSFATLESAQSFVDRIKKETDRDEDY